MLTSRMPLRFIVESVSVKRQTQTQMQTQTQTQTQTQKADTQDRAFLTEERRVPALVGVRNLFSQ